MRRREEKSREVLIIGAGIAGCAAALALAKKGIPVTIMTSSFDQRTYHAFFPQMDQLEEQIRHFRQNIEERSRCLRAVEQLSQLAKKSVDELLEPEYLIDKRGNLDIHRCLQEQLKQHAHIEWIPHHSAIELLTLETHSSRKSDVYKKTTCLGAYVYNHETHQVEKILAKETILATGGATSLFPYSTHGSTVKGDGLAMAYRAGARLLNMEDTQFHPIALFERDRSCFPLPIELLKEGGKLQTIRNSPLNDIQLDHHLINQIYEELFKSQAEHLWLDLTLLDSVSLKEKFPLVDAYCLAHGFNIAKDPLPVVPAAQHTYGGVAVDRVGQTTVQRLRAIGEVACTGLAFEYRDEATGVLESLTWAMTCAEDIAKQISKFVYYFPEVKDWDLPIDHQAAFPANQEDWRTLRQIMWYYVGIKRDRQRLKRGYSLLEQLSFYHESEEKQIFCLENWHLFNAFQVALLMTQAALEKTKMNRALNQLVYI
jgi:L-aspartate oxidase